MESDKARESREMKRLKETFDAVETGHRAASAANRNKSKIRAATNESATAANEAAESGHRSCETWMERCLEIPLAGDYPTLSNFFHLSFFERWIP